MAELKYDWVIRLFFTILLIFIFLFIFLHPLWKLSKSRPAMIIVFSRAIGSLLEMLSQMPEYLMSYILCIYYPPIVVYLSNGSIMFGNIILATHILALAVNRAHSIIFPFHYNWFSTKKRNFYIICTLLWIFSLIATSVDQIVKLWTIRPLAPFSIIHKICMGFGAFCYVALTCQLLWLKYKKNPTLSSSAASTEKDQFRILIVCFSCLFMSSFRYLIYDPIAAGTTKNWSQIPRIIMTWISFFTTLLTVCTEEICLLFLVHDFRKDVKKQLRRIFCFFKKSSSTNNINSITTVSSTKNTRAQINNWTQKN